MSEPYPRIRVRARNGVLVLREGLSITFYMKRFHQEVLPGLLRSLEEYRRAIGPGGLSFYFDDEGEAVPFDSVGEASVLRRLREGDVITRLTDGAANETRYHFLYFGKRPNLPALKHEPGWASTISYWLPTEYLEEHGPQRVRELVLALAAPLPFCTGYAGLSFNISAGIMEVWAKVRELCFRHPALDIPDVSSLSWRLGTQVLGVSWMTFLGQPLLGELGGVDGLRSRLHSPGTTVEALDADRAVVTLGEWPEAGDTEQGQTLPAYRELARVLEPWLYHARLEHAGFTPEEMRRWERRFLE